MGTPGFAVESLRQLSQSECCDVVGVVTAPDRPAGRGQKLTPPAVKVFAEAHLPEVPILQPVKLRAPAFHAELEALAADLFVVVAFRMLPAAVFERPRLGSVNLHASLLPDLRGAAPINWALVYGYEETGATTFFIQQEIDTGKMLDQVRLRIQPNWHAGDLHDALMEAGAGLLVQTICRLQAGDASAQPQVLTGSERPAPKLTPEMGQIDWREPVRAIQNHVRGFTPFPGAFTYAETADGQRIKIGAIGFAHSIGLGNADPGTVRIQANALYVRCADGWAQVLKLQPPGKRMLAVADWLRGRPDLPTRFLPQ